jgi:ribosomal protein L37E
MGQAAAGRGRRAALIRGPGEDPGSSRVLISCDRCGANSPNREERAGHRQGNTAGCGFDLPQTRSPRGEHHLPGRERQNATFPAEIEEALKKGQDPGCWGHGASSGTETLRLIFPASNGL